jgi:hypothetical protein
VTSVDHHLTGKMIVIEHSANSKKTSFLNNACHLSDALNAQFRAAFIRRRNQDLDSNIRSDWRASSAEDQRSVESDVAGEPPLHLFSPIIPVEDDGESQLVPNFSSAL